MVRSISQLPRQLSYAKVLNVFLSTHVTSSRVPIFCLPSHRRTVHHHSASCRSTTRNDSSLGPFFLLVNRTIERSKPLFNRPKFGTSKLKSEHDPETYMRVLLNNKVHRKTSLHARKPISLLEIPIEGKTTGNNGFKEADSRSTRVRHGEKVTIAPPAGEPPGQGGGGQPSTLEIHIDQSISASCQFAK